MDKQSKDQDVMEQSRTKRWRPNGPVIVGGFFATLAIVMTLVGLWREDNLTLRNIVLGIVLSGGTWGLVSWAIATAVVQVEEDVAARRDKDG